MQAKRCQLCDGAVRNGRCVLCGMPYRQEDEITYHLNENRRDHYRHATAAAQKLMRESQIPLGDKGKAEQADRVYRAQKQMVSEKNDAKKNVRNSSTRNSQMYKTKKEAKKSNPVFMIIMIIIIINSLASCLSI